MQKPGNAKYKLENMIITHNMIINSRKQYIPAFSISLQLLSSLISHESKFVSLPIHLGLLSKDGLAGILITNGKPPVELQKFYSHVSLYFLPTKQSKMSTNNSCISGIPIISTYCCVLIVNTNHYNTNEITISY